tara:strand:- start:4771 stop:6939 length:2169 start_codon:yes stop_codon:yes gene_type:complete
MGGRNPQGTPQPLQEQMPPAKTDIDPLAPIGSVKPTPNVSPIPQWEPNPEDPVADYEQKMEWLQSPDYEYSTEGQSVLQWMDSPKGQKFQKIIAHTPSSDFSYGEQLQQLGAAFPEYTKYDKFIYETEGVDKKQDVFKEIKQLDPDNSLKWVNHGGAWQVYDPYQGTTLEMDELNELRDHLKAQQGLEFSTLPKQKPGASLLDKGLDLASALPWGRNIQATKKIIKTLKKLNVKNVKENIRQFKNRYDPRVRKDIREKERLLKIKETKRLARGEEQGYDFDDPLVHVLKGFEVVKRMREAGKGIVPQFDSKGNIKKDERTYGAFDPERKVKWTGDKWIDAIDNRGYIYLGEDIPRSNQAAQETGWNQIALQDIDSFERRYDISWDDFAGQYGNMLEDYKAGNRENEKILKEFHELQTMLRSIVAVQRAVIRGPVAGREIHVPSSIMELPDEVTLDDYNAMMEKANKFDYESLGKYVEPGLAKRIVKTNIALAYSKFTEDPVTGRINIQAPDDPNRGLYTLREVLADEELKKRAFPENYDDLTEDDFSDMLDSPILPKEPGGQINLTRHKKLSRAEREAVKNSRVLSEYTTGIEFIPGWSELEKKYTDYSDEESGYPPKQRNRPVRKIIPYRETLKALGFTGSKSHDEAGTSTAIFDPSAIRAPWAKFDEKKKHSNNILASILLGGLITKGQLARLKRESEPQKRTKKKEPAKRKREGRRKRE